MLSDAQVQEAAGRLYDAETKRYQIRALSLEYPEMTMVDAYAIQQRWVDMKIREGRQVIGYKIGLTSRAMQMAVNIDEPDYGVLLNDMRFDNRSSIQARNFTDPRMEVEFAFVLKAPLFGTEVSLDEVVAATDYVVPALELIAARSCRTDPETGYTRTVMDSIADNAGGAGVILGDKRVRPSEIDLKWAGALLYLDGEVEETGIAAGVLGHPAHGIRWLCRRFAPHGIGLKPGQILLSGSFTRPVAVRPGDSIRADYGEYGDVCIDFV